MISKVGDFKNKELKTESLTNVGVDPETSVVNLV
jgi:hypothetical protein